MLLMSKFEAIFGRHMLFNRVTLEVGTNIGPLSSTSGLAFIKTFIASFMVGQSTKTFMPIRQSWARSTATITGLTHMNCSCLRNTSHSPNVARALSTSHENNLIDTFFKLLFWTTWFSSKSSPIRSNNPLLMTVTGEPVSIIAVAVASFTESFTAIF